MMGTFIKNMKTPKVCGLCPFRHINMSGYLICEMLHKQINLTKFNERFKDCPLVEVKEPHGRLIDIKSVEDNKFAIAENNYKNQWTAKKQDDEIKVGDEGRWGMDLIVITRLYMDGGFKWCDGISKNGIAFHVLKENVSKTNRHFDIESIMKAMSEAQ